MFVCVVSGGMLLGMSCSAGKHQPEGSIIADSLENNCVAGANILLLLNFNDHSSAVFAIKTH